MADEATAERFKPLLAKANSGYCFYPLVFLSGELMGVGNAEYYQVLRYVRRYFEVMERP